MANFKRLSPHEAKRLVDDGWVYIDVRTESEYAAGHPVGAHNVPVMIAGTRGMQENPDFLAVVDALFERDAKIVVGCKGGGRSMRAAEMLTGSGYTSVVDQRAGFDGARDPFGRVTEPGWSTAGLPVETTTPGGSYAELRTRAGKG